MAQDSQQ